MKWLRFLPSLSSLQIYAVVFAAGLAAGGWAIHKVVKAGEVRALEGRIAELGKLRESGLTVQAGYYQDLLAIERGKVASMEALRHVKDNRTCDIPEPVERMLDARRQGLSATPGRAAESAGGAAAAALLSQRQELAGHVDLADRLSACRQQIIRLNEWYQGIK